MITFISADHSKYFEKPDNESKLSILFDVFITRMYKFNVIKSAIKIVAGTPVISVIFSVFDGLTSCLMSHITSISYTVTVIL